LIGPCLFVLAFSVILNNASAESHRSVISWESSECDQLWITEYGGNMTYWYSWLTNTSPFIYEVKLKHMLKPRSLLKNITKRKHMVKLRSLLNNITKLNHMVKLRSLLKWEYKWVFFKLQSRQSLVILFNNDLSFNVFKFGDIVQ
jgi:hypothetical protein